MINDEQHLHYQLRPLFRSLIIVVDDCASDGAAEMIIHLIRTNISSRLKAPISVENIRPRLKHNTIFENINDNMITTLSAAINFVMALNKREQRAYPENYRDPNIRDEGLGDSRSYMEIATSQGYTGPEIRDPSSDWIELAEGEDLIALVTPYVVQRRNKAGLPSPCLASRRTLVVLNLRIIAAPFGQIAVGRQCGR